jgi:hypothetical protein
MMIKGMRSFLSAVMLLVIAVAVQAQVTTSSMSGKVTDANNETIIGATVQAIHEPSGAVYGAITNVDGRYSITNMRAGGPYKVEVSYVGYQTVVFKDINLQLGENLVLNPFLKESTELLDEVVVVASKNSNMKSNRSGAMTNVDANQMAMVPTASRSLSDIMKLSPQASSTTNGFAVGGGNYRQSNVTIDGAQFNNTFGLGSGNLPGGGTPISLDAIDQMTVSVTPYDVRQSGFIGGAINAVTKSGTNQFKGTAYMHLTSNDLRGTRVGGSSFSLDDAHTNTYGFTLGGPILKDKLFFFVNGEYEDIITAGPTARAGTGSGSYTNTNRRPTLDQLTSFSDYMYDKYGYQTGVWQGYNLDTPAYRLLARIDWNINKDNKFNVRFTRSNRKSSSAASTSRSIGTNQQNAIYNGANGTYGSGSYYGMSSLSSRYYAEYRFTSVAAELNSKIGKVQNTLRGTYSYQDQPRSNEYGDQPIIELVMNDGQDHYPTWALTGDVFTMGNLSQTKNLVLTDEANLTLGKHNLFAGIQYEHNNAANGYAQAAAGYYAYEVTADEAASGDWASVFARDPRVFGITYGNNDAHSMFTAKMSTNQWSLYLQDNMDLTNNFKLSAGVRFELPTYPDLKNNYNEDYYKLDFGGNHYRTDNTPDASISFSPRVGFNWDLTGERKYVLRGGTGLFVGRMPFVWLVSAVGNSGMGQTSYVATTDNGKTMPSFTMSQSNMLQQIGATSATSVPTGPTIMADDLRMPKTWKASLAFDAKLPGDIDFTLEGIYNKDLNPVVVSNKNVYWDGVSTVDLGNGDVRHKMSTYNKSNQAYVLENAGHKAYYYSISAQLRKSFDFGLDLSASYTHSQAKSYTEGIGDQVSSAYTSYRSSINAVIDNETGYATYVAPNRVLVAASYKIKGCKKNSSTFSLIYDGSENGYMSSYSYSRYSYIFASNVTSDASAPGNLIFIPASREALNNWDFKEGTVNGEVYTADMQRDDFWAYINQDSYLKNHKGEYAERGGAKMPWHHQLDFKFVQDYKFRVGSTEHGLQFAVDIENLPNLISKNWGTYKQITSNTLLSYSNGQYSYNLVNGARHLTTYQKYQGLASTYKVMFSVRYTFN